MLLKSKRVIAATAVAGALSAGAVGAAAPAFAQGPVVTGGLVNVTVTNLLNNNLNHNTVTVTIPVSVAANICGVSVLGAVGTTCTATSGNRTLTINSFMPAP